ncbi:MAG TPA: hypothetical protein VGE97_09490 [Nitrososphaera sp.]
MAITAANKIKTSAASGTSITSASLTPSVNKLYLCWVAQRRGKGTTNLPTVSGGGGLNWVQVESKANGNSRQRLTLFRALKTSGLSSGPVTVSFAGQDQDSGIILIIDEYESVVITGTDGEDAIVQHNSNKTDSDSTSLSVTLSSFADAVNNAAVGGIYHGANTSTTPEGGYTELADQGVGSLGLETEWKVGEDTSVSASYSTAGAAIGIAVEVKYLNTGPQTIVVNEPEEDDSAFAARGFVTPSEYLSADMPALRVEIGFGAGAADPIGSTLFQDVTAYVRDFSIQAGKGHELDPPQASLAHVTLDNRDRRFEPEYDGSPYYPDIQPLCPIRISAYYGGMYYVLYTGWVEEWPVEWGRVSESQVTLSCVDRFEMINQAILIGDYPEQTSGERIAAVLEDIGITDYDIDIGQSTVAAITLDKVSALQHILEIAQSELGLFFVNKEGTPTFYDRSTRYNYPVASAIYGDGGS